MIRQFLTKQNICLRYDTVIPPLDTHAREMSACVPKKTCRRMLRSALFILDQNWNHFKQKNNKFIQWNKY